VRVRDLLGLSERRQRQASQLMQTSLVGVFFIGLYLGEIGIVVNAALGIGVTQLVPVLERDYGIPMDPGLVLWISAAVFLHAFGTLPLPAEYVELVGDVPAGQDRTSLYKSGGWWDHLTHALSSSLIAAVGYSTVRALDEHDPNVDIPSRLMFVFILMFVLAFGVFWEVMEFVVGAIADLTGVRVLTQYGLEDTMKDMIFNTIGGLFVAVWGTAYLTDVVGAIQDRLEARGQSN
jgi:hypothetical protein